MKKLTEKLLLKYLFLYNVGGLSYVLLELLWRQHSHWTMFILGGICFVCLGLINEILSWETPFFVQTIIGACIITCLEFFTGCVVNLWLGWNIWDYSSLPGNILGQICPQYFFMWIIVAAPVIVLDDYLRYWFFGEEHPRYIF